jgi:acyl-coenzyme A thioesterase PaaI-like protein
LEGILKQSENLTSDIMAILEGKIGDHTDGFAFPPPIFEAMKGEILELDLDAASLTAQFPVLESYLNPYGTMQGGMVAAAVDNTIGPLSVLVAPFNITRQLEMKFSKPVTLDMEYITVKARLIERKDRFLTFNARSRSQDGQLLARTKAVHWIIVEEVVVGEGTK